MGICLKCTCKRGCREGMVSTRLTLMWCGQVSQRQGAAAAALSSSRSNTAAPSESLIPVGAEKAAGRNTKAMDCWLLLCKTSGVGEKSQPRGSTCSHCGVQGTTLEYRVPLWGKEHHTGVQGTTVGYRTSQRGSGHHCGVQGPTLGLRELLWRTGFHSGVKGITVGFRASLWGTEHHTGAQGTTLEKASTLRFRALLWGTGSYTAVQGTTVGTGHCSGVHSITVGYRAPLWGAESRCSLGHSGSPRPPPPPRAQLGPSPCHVSRPGRALTPGAPGSPPG